MARRLEITEAQEGAAHVVELEGKLDAITSPSFDAHVGRIFLDDRAAQVVVDMTRCEYVSSAGLRVIVALQKRASAGGSLVFRNVIPAVMDILTSTGFDHILTIE